MSNQSVMNRASKKLEVLLNENRLDDFVAALSAGANVNHRFEKSSSVFELACKKPNRRAFIEQCICFGAQLKKPTLDPNIFPIHLAAQSNDVENLKALLNNQHTSVDQKSFNGQTALCMLFETITPHNYNNVWNCIKLLLEYHANINTKNSEQKTPIQLVLENESLSNDKKFHILEYCFLNYYCNVDEDTKSLIETQSKPQEIDTSTRTIELIIPEYASQHKLFDQLRDILNSETVDEFIKICQQEENSIRNLKPEMICRLLQITIHREKFEAAGKLLELKSVEGKVDNYRKLLEGLLKKCCVFGDVEILQQILDVVPKDAVDFLNEDSLLSILVDHMGSKMEQFNNSFYECMEILLEDDRIDIDKRDGMNRTALEFAGEYKNDRAQRMLLAKGAYVGGEDLSGGHVLGTINLDVLQNHLDSCVTGSARQLNSMTLEVNVMNFVPPQFKSNYKEHKYQHSNDESFHNVLVALIEFMECDSSAKKIILHPVVLCLLNLKFGELWLLEFVEFALSFILFLGLGWYALLLNEAKPSDLFESLRVFLGIGTIVSILYLIVHIILRYLRVKKVWINRIIEFFFDVIVRVASIYYLYNGYGDENQHVLGGYIILGSGIVIILALRTVPFFSIGPNISKFFVVLFNLLYMITFGICLLALSAMSFHVINSNRIVHNSTATQGPILNHTSNVSYSTNSSVTPDDQFNTFADKFLAMLKVVVMMTGEFNSGEMDLKKTGFAIMFTLFVFGVAIAFYNLLTGLVVRDVAILEEESIMLGIKEKIIKLYEWNMIIQYLVPMFNTRERLFGVHINTTVQRITIELKPKDIIIKTISFRKPERSTVVPSSQETVEAAPGATSNSNIENTNRERENDTDKTKFKRFARYIISEKLELALKEIVHVSKKKTKMN